MVSEFYCVLLLLVLVRASAFNIPLTRYHNFVNRNTRIFAINGNFLGERSILSRRKNNIVNVVKVVGPFVATCVLNTKRSFAATDEEKYISSFAAILEAIEIIKPTKTYVEIAAYGL